jgi:hypothetical protein
MDWYEVHDCGRERHRTFLDEAARQRQRRDVRRGVLRARTGAALIALGQRLTPADEQGVSLAGVQPVHAKS